MGLIAALNFPEGISKSKTAIMKLLLLTALAAVALAEPEADAYYGYGGYYGHGLYGYGYHQLGWPSYSAPGFTSTVWGARGKRSAEPSAEPHGYGFYGYHPYAYGLYHPYAYRHHVAAIAAPEGTGVAGHPGGATSYSHRSPKVLAKDPLKNLLKMIKFTEPDTTAMLDKPSGDSPGPRGLPKK